MKQQTGLSATRREFIRASGAAAAMATLPCSLRMSAASPASELETRLAADPMRPQFHLLPARNWMNDPNGPIYIPNDKSSIPNDKSGIPSSKSGLNGQYHMFFQYNPLAAVWGDMSWYHSVSPDMVHWRHMPVAFTPTPGSADSFGCFSGSALRVGKRVYQVYTGTQKSDDAHATIRDGANNIQESQCLAYSDDPKLVTWTKVAEPIIPLPPKGMNITGFRDPSAWRAGDWYYMTVGSGEAGVGGCVLLYRSPAGGDLKQWEYMHKLTSGEWNGRKTPNPCDDGEMWECPDFFPLGTHGKHVLIYSTLDKVFWQSGVLDPGTMLFHPEHTGELDLGKAFYAPKTQLDAQGRRILWGWLREARSDDAMKQAGWSGMMGLPRVLTLDANGMLKMEFLPELARLRSPAQQDALAAASPHEHTQRIQKARGEFLYAAAPGGSAFALTLRTDSAELLKINYANGAISFAGQQVSLLAGETPHLHGYIDGSVIEVMVNGRVGYTKRFYYAEASAPDVTVDLVHHPDSGIATSRVWDIAPISSNRLTTPGK